MEQRDESLCRRGAQTQDRNSDMGRPVEFETPKPAFSKATPPKPTQNSTTNKRPSIQIAVPVGDIQVQTTPAFKNYTESDTLIAFQKFHFC